MRRNLDLLRSILIALEENPQAEMRYAPEIGGFNRADTAEHIHYLGEAKFVTFKSIRGLDHEGPDFVLIRITMLGHDFLDSIRDPHIWAQTKNEATKLGSWTIGLIGDLAKGYIKAKAHALGLPL